MSKNRKVGIGMMAGLMLSILSCEKNEIYTPDTYACNFGFQDTSVLHPHARDYQNILEMHRKNGLVGAVVLVRDKNGLWMGADGKADVAGQNKCEIKRMGYGGIADLCLWLEAHQCLRRRTYRRYRRIHYHGDLFS